MAIDVTAPKETEAKEVNYPRGFEKRFERAMTKMVDAMYQQFENQAILALNQTTIDKFEDAKNKQIGNYAEVFKTLSARTVRKIKKRFNNRRIKKLTNDILSALSKQTQKELYNSIQVATGISQDELVKQENLNPETNALMAETEEWVKRLRDDNLTEMVASTLRNMSLGNDIQGVLKEYKKLEKKSKNNAKFVARQQLATYNSLQNKIRYQNLGITKAIWITAKDERVRPSHADREGKEFDLSKGLYSSIDKKYLLPGIDWNCRCVYKVIIPEE